MSDAFRPYNPALAVSHLVHRGDLIIDSVGYRGSAYRFVLNIQELDGDQYVTTVDFDDFSFHGSSQWYCPIRSDSRAHVHKGNGDLLHAYSVHDSIEIMVKELTQDLGEILAEVEQARPGITR